ncbi:sensor histidine kinase [Nocardia sp. CA-119907]|uniref:sensor histidine kinase n=1 Tax=Nocardia sp. CA-119907 TaxID=3239973 RepID=UPI003D97A41B
MPIRSQTASAGDLPAGGQQASTPQADGADAGLDIAFEQTAPATPLPSAVGSAAYRIVQKSITNVIRHVSPTRVTVALEPSIDALRITVIDAGRRDPARSGSAPTTGRGIVGMRERCQLLGGELDATARPDGGFEVTARLPLTPVGSRL